MGLWAPWASPNASARPRSRIGSATGDPTGRCGDRLASLSVPSQNQKRGYGARMPRPVHSVDPQERPEPGGAARDAWGTSRQSRLFPGAWLAHADLHNHTRLSDGAGDPARAFACMRAAGLDVAAITDHSRWGSAFLGVVRAPGWTGIDAHAWREAAELADAANIDGAFVALRGFEWSHAAYGHMNVWGSQRFTDPLRTFPTMARWWRWLERRGDDGLASFNHPGTGRLRFARFSYRPAVAERLVGLEIFNKTDEYLFKGTEHGAGWGYPEGKGRTGLYVRELSRRGVIEALAARRFFASRVKGLRVDAALTSLKTSGGFSRARSARMGTTLAHAAGPVLF